MHFEEKDVKLPVKRLDVFVEKKMDQKPHRSLLSNTEYQNFETLLKPIKEIDFYKFCDNEQVICPDSANPHP